MVIATYGTLAEGNSRRVLNDDRTNGVVSGGVTSRAVVNDDNNGLSLALNRGLHSGLHSGLSGDLSVVDRSLGGALSDGLDGIDRGLGGVVDGLVNGGVLGGNVVGSSGRHLDDEEVELNKVRKVRCKRW